MEKGNEKRYIVFRDGSKKLITNEDGKYYYVKGSQYRKASTDILEIVTEQAEEKPKAETSKKNKASSKKKEKKFEEGFDVIPDVSDILQEEFKD